MSEKTFSVKIEAIHEISENIKSFKLSKPEGFSHKPGQYVWVSLPNRPELAASPMAIASGTDEPFVLLTVRLWGDLTEALFKMSEKEVLQISNAQGTSLPTIEGKIIAITGGTAITPVRSLFYSTPEHLRSHFKLFYGVKDESAIMYTNELVKMNTELVLETPTNGWTGPIGLVTSLLNGNTIDTNAHYFVVGPNPMISAVSEKLLNHGVSAESIYVSVEKFIDNEVFGPVFSLQGLKNIQSFTESLLG